MRFHCPSRGSSLFMLGVLCVVPTAVAWAQAPVPVTVCELADSFSKRDNRFKGKLLELDAYVSSGFEEHTLHDPECPEEALINAPSDHRRIEFEYAQDPGGDSSLKLVVDEHLRRFKALLAERGGRRNQLVRARLLGTFATSEDMVEDQAKEEARRETEKAQRGSENLPPREYIPDLIFSTVFVIHRVLWVETEYDPGLDYSNAEWNIGYDKKQGCYAETELDVPTNDELVTRQKRAIHESGSGKNAARAAAQQHLDKLLSSDNIRHGGGSYMSEADAQGLHPPSHPRPVMSLFEVESKPYLKTFEWIARDRKHKYVIVVARPYWLSRVVSSSEDVIWAPVGASVISCVASK